MAWRCTMAYASSRDTPFWVSAISTRWEWISPPRRSRLRAMYNDYDLFWNKDKGTFELGITANGSTI